MEPNPIVLELVFSYLNIETIVTVIPYVSKTWRQCVNESAIWCRYKHTFDSNYSQNKENWAGLNVIRRMTSLQHLEMRVKTEYELTKITKILVNGMPRLRTLKIHSYSYGQTPYTKEKAFSLKCKNSLTKFSTNILTPSWALALRECTLLEDLVITGKYSNACSKILSESQHSLNSLNLTYWENSNQLLLKNNCRNLRKALLPYNSYLVEGLNKYCHNIDELHLTFNKNENISDNKMNLLNISPRKVELISYRNFPMTGKFIEDFITGLRTSNLVTVTIETVHNECNKAAKLLFESCPLLIELTLKQWLELTYCGLSSILNCQQIQSLKLIGCHKLTGDCLKYIAKCRRIKTFYFWECGSLGDIGLKKIVTMKNIEELCLSISSFHELNDNNILAELPKLSPENCLISEITGHPSYFKYHQWYYL